MQEINGKTRPIQASAFREKFWSKCHVKTIHLVPLSPLQRDNVFMKVMKYLSLAFIVPMIPNETWMPIGVKISC